MKHILTILFLFFSMLSSGQSLFFPQNNAGINLLDGLLSYNTFDATPYADEYGDTSYDPVLSGTDSDSNVAGLLSNAVQFTGYRYVLIAQGLTTEDEEFSISFWVRFVSALPDEAVRICSSIPGATNSNGICIRFDSVNGDIEGGWINATNTGYTSMTTIDASPAIDTWMNYTVTIERNGVYAYIKFYKNGTFIKTIQSTIFYNLDMCLAYDFNVPTVIATPPTTIAVYDDVKLWNKTLNAVEIKYNYNNGNGRAL